MRGIRLKIQNLGKKIKIREGGREREEERTRRSERKKEDDTDDKQLLVQCRGGGKNTAESILYDGKI